jgi:AhpD family alkylhydroperoxidase
MADDVQVAKRRLDASANEALIGMARMGADAFGYRADLRIDRCLAELLRLRVSQLNNCTYCLNLHYQAAREAGVPRAKIDTKEEAVRNISRLMDLAAVSVAQPDSVHRKPRSHKIARAGAAFLTAITISGSVITLSACNTTAGAGKDVSATGHAVSGAAERTKQGL